MIATIADRAEEALLLGGLTVVGIGAAIQRAGYHGAAMRVATVGAAIIIAGREIGWAVGTRAALGIARYT